MTAPALACQGVTKRYGAVEALRGVDVSFPAGVVAGLVGPNGAGKTTLFSIACGFLRADAGAVSILGQPVRPGHPPPRGALSILPQDAGFMSQLTARQLLEYYARLAGMELPAARTEAARVLELVSLSDVADRPPDTMSHGQRKRVGIAQAFLGNPRVIILDEPTAGLDPKVARDIRATIRGARDGQTVIVSSHNLGEVEDLCSQVAIISRGVVTRQDDMGSLLGAAAELSFRMAAAPPETAMAALRALAPVSEATWDAGAARLRVAFDPEGTSSEQTTSDVVACLAQHGVSFLDMQVGRSLEDRYLDETR